MGVPKGLPSSAARPTSSRIIEAPVTPHSSARPPYLAGICAPNQPCLAISFTPPHGNCFFQACLSHIGINTSSTTLFASSASFFCDSFHHGKCSNCYLLG